MTVYKWKSFVYKCLPVNKSQDEIIEIDSWLKYALKTQTKLKRHVWIWNYICPYLPSKYKGMLRGRKLQFSNNVPRGTGIKCMFITRHSQYLIQFTAVWSCKLQQPMFFQLLWCELDYLETTSFQTTLSKNMAGKVDHSWIRF